MYTDVCVTSYIDLNWVFVSWGWDEDWRADLMFGEIVMTGAGHLPTKTGTYILRNI